MRQLELRRHRTTFLSLPIPMFAINDIMIAETSAQRGLPPDGRRFYRGRNCLAAGIPPLAECMASYATQKEEGIALTAPIS